jgi:hypothetical protein
VNWFAGPAFLCGAGVTYDLNTLVNGLGADTILTAHEISNLGQIVGYGLHNDNYGAFVLTPNGVAPPANAPPTADAVGPYATTPRPSFGCKTQDTSRWKRTSKRSPSPWGSFLHRRPSSSQEMRRNFVSSTSAA